MKQITAKYQHHKDQLGYTRLYAPFSGYIQKRLFEAHYMTELEDGIRLAYEDFLNNPMRAER